MGVRRIAVFGGVVVTVVVLSSGTAWAHQCTNANKPPGAGAQVVINEADELVFATKGVMNRISRGLIDPETGDGFHGLVGFDVDGDGEADLMTYIVTPTGEIPPQAQQRGSSDHGIINICGGSCE